MAEARYLFRLDDANPWMDVSRWDAFENVLSRFGIKPIVAIIPHCADQGVMSGPFDPNFWDKARRWQALGWTVALHGYDHVYLGKSGGLVPLNRQTEFAGIPEAVQREKIRQGWALLKSEGLQPTVWVAPSHTFDRTTLRCLHEETSIRIVSDGLSTRCFTRFGFTWVPQQLWRPRVQPSGIWTVCLHPNTADNRLVADIETFLSSHCASVTSVPELDDARHKWGLYDATFGALFLVARPLKKLWGPLKLALKRFLR